MYTVMLAWEIKTARQHNVAFVHSTMSIPTIAKLEARLQAAEVSIADTNRVARKIGVALTAPCCEARCGMDTLGGGV